MGSSTTTWSIFLGIFNPPPLRSHFYQKDLYEVKWSFGQSPPLSTVHLVYGWPLCTIFGSEKYHQTLPFSRFNVCHYSQKYTHFIHPLKIRIVFVKQTLSYVISWPNVINKRPFEQLAIKSPSIFVVNKKPSFFRLIQDRRDFLNVKPVVLFKNALAHFASFFTKKFQRICQNLA